MKEIFISYRRNDSQDAVGRIHDWLEDYFGPDATFRDIDSIRSGKDFPEELDRALNECKVFLAVIGPIWVTVMGDSGKLRILEDDDYVRTEIAAALSRGKTIIPVLVTHAPMPDRATLPPDIAKLASIDACHVEPGKNFRTGIEYLIKRISEESGLIPDEYPEAILNCRKTGLSATWLGLMSKSPSVTDAIIAARDVTIVMNDGRGFLDSMQEEIAGRYEDPQKSTHVLLLHPKSPFIDTLIKKNRKEKSRQKGDIFHGFNALMKSRPSAASLEIRGSHSFFPSSYVVTERHVFVSPYMLGERGSLPVFKFVSTGDKRSLYNQLREDVEEAFKMAVVLEAADFDDL